MFETKKNLKFQMSSDVHIQVVQSIEFTFHVATASSFRSMEAYPQDATDFAWEDQEDEAILPEEKLIYIWIILDLKMYGIF